MLTSGATITAALRFIVNPGSDSYLYDEALRARGLYMLREVGAELHTLAPHWWKLGDGTISLTAGDGFGTVPADFSSFGESGQVYIQSQKIPLRYVAPDVLFALVELEGQSASVPEFYTLHNRTSTGRPKLYVYPTNSGAVTLSLRNYKRRVPDFIDLPMLAPTLAAGDAGALTGAYTFKITYVTAVGETEGGTASNSVTLATQKANLTEIPVSLSPQVTSRKVYRPIAGDTVSYLLAATIADNTTTVLTGHNVADGALGVAMPTVLTAVTGMEEFPEDFHELLIVPALAAKLDPSKRFDWEHWEKKSRRLWNDQMQGQNVVHVMPRYGQGGGGVSRSRLRSIIGG